MVSELCSKEGGNATRKSRPGDPCCAPKTAPSPFMLGLPRGCGSAGQALAGSAIQHPAASPLSWVAAQHLRSFALCLPRAELLLQLSPARLRKHESSSAHTRSKERIQPSNSFVHYRSEACQVCSSQWLGHILDRSCILFEKVVEGSLELCECLV